MTSFDLRHVLRRLRRAPGFSLLCIALLGLAFGALACIASVLHGLLLKPLPFAQAERLVSVESRILGIPFDVGLPTPLRDDIAAYADGIEGIAAWRESNTVVRDAAGRRIGTLKTALVEPQVFALLGAQPALGRLFAAEDVAEGAARSAVLSWQEWQIRYAGAEDAIGRMLTLEGNDYRIVGVLPKDFAFPGTTTRLWLPLGFGATEHQRSHAGNFDGTLAIARLRPGHDITATSDEVTRLARAIPELEGAFGGSFKLQVTPLRERWVGDRRDALLLMLLAATMVWLVTAANVANLFLARALERRQESALAAALGATPWQRARAAIAEAAVLCGAAAALGTALLPAGLALLRHFDLLPAGTPQAIGIDLPTLALMAGLALALCAVLAGVGLSVQRGNLNDMIRHGGSRHTAGGAAQLARKSLVVAQVALTVALLFGIGVLLRSSQNLLAEDVGFQRDHLLYVSLQDLVPDGATAEARATLLAGLVERTRALPGVAAAGLGSMIPFGTSIATSNYTPPGLEDIKDKPIAYDQKVDAGYFDALGIRLLRGRGFSADEVRAEAPIAVVDEMFAKRHFGDADPIGRRFSMGVGPDQSDRELTIVGLAPTLKQRALDETTDRPAIYQPFAAPPYAAMAVRTRLAPALLVEPLKALGREIAPDDALGPIVTLDERIADTLQERTRLNSLLGLLALTALLLAGVGLYAVLAYAVRQRVAEFGVRMALGARASTVLRHVLGQGLALVGCGLALGLPLAWTFARLLSARLYGVGRFDPATLVAVATALAAIGILACLWPARRAATTDPATALRGE